MDEARLIQRLKQRDEDAFRRFVREYEQPVYHLVFRLLGDAEEARDVSQEVFVSVFRAIGSFRGEARLSTWLYRIATNHCRNRQKYLGRRSHGRHESYEEYRVKTAPPIAGERLPQPDREAEARRMERAVQQAIAALEEEHRELIVLRDIQGLSYEEIQTVTGLASGTVKSRLHRARVALKAKIAPLLE